MGEDKEVEILFRVCEVKKSPVAFGIMKVEERNLRTAQVGEKTRLRGSGEAE